MAEIAKGPGIAGIAGIAGIPKWLKIVTKNVGNGNK